MEKMVHKLYSSGSISLAWLMVHGLSVLVQRENLDYSPTGKPPPLLKSERTLLSLLDGASPSKDLNTQTVL